MRPSDKQEAIHEIERLLIERYLYLQRRRLFILLRWRLEKIAYAS